MLKEILIAFSLGMLFTVALIETDGLLAHTNFNVITMPFMLPLNMLAALVAYGISKGHAGSAHETAQLYGLMILFGGIFWGFVIFCMLRSRTKK